MSATHTSEGEIQDGFAAWLRARNIPFIMPARHRRSTVARGCQDCTAFMPGGKVLCIEMKTEKGKRSKEQEQWAEAMAAVGHHVYLCRSLEECILEADRLCMSGFVVVGEGVWAEYRGKLRHIRKAQPGDEKLYRRL